MKKILIIPDRENLQKSLDLANEYNLGFEYNDFFNPDVLDSDECINNIVSEYKKNQLPDFATMHGAFLDVLPFSADEKIREVSMLRINQSLCVARKIGAKSVVFHLNYNPFLKIGNYVNDFVEKNIAIWKRILKENPDVNIYIENMFEQNSDVIKSIADALCGCANFGVCLDWSHAVLSNTPPEIWAEQLKDYVKHIHINDNELESDSHLAWGDGKIDRNLFYKCYDEFLSNATVLLETTGVNQQRKSMEQLKKDGII